MRTGAGSGGRWRRAGFPATPGFRPADYESLSSRILPADSWRPRAQGQMAARGAGEAGAPAWEGRAAGCPGRGAGWRVRVQGENGGLDAQRRG